MPTKTKAKKKPAPRKKKVKTSSCRVAGEQMNSKNATMRKVGAKKLGSKTCKTKAQIKKSTSKVAEISKLAKKIRKPGETWQTAIKRASKQI